MSASTVRGYEANARAIAQSKIGRRPVAVLTPADFEARGPIEGRGERAPCRVPLYLLVPAGLLTGARMDEPL
jgi:hypothetical protein